MIETIEAADEVWLPFIVLGELRAGFAVGSQGPRNEAILRRFLLKPGVEVLYADEQTTHHYGNVYRQLRKQGTPVPTNDMWIAALVLQHSLMLYDRDAHSTHFRNSHACRGTMLHPPSDLNGSFCHRHLISW